MSQVALVIAAIGLWLTASLPMVRFIVWLKPTDDDFEHRLNVALAFLITGFAILTWILK